MAILITRSETEKTTKANTTHQIEGAKPMKSKDNKNVKLAI